MADQRRRWEFAVRRGRFDGEEVRSPAAERGPGGPPEAGEEVPAVCQNRSRRRAQITADARMVSQRAVHGPHPVGRPGAVERTLVVTLGLPVRATAVVPLVFGENEPVVAREHSAEEIRLSTGPPVRQQALGVVHPRPDPEALAPVEYVRQSDLGLDEVVRVPVEQQVTALQLGVNRFRVAESEIALLGHGYRKGALEAFATSGRGSQTCLPHGNLHACRVRLAAIDPRLDSSDGSSSPPGRRFDPGDRGRCPDR